MTKRSELQHCLAEFKAKLEIVIANRLFSARRGGVDRVLKLALKPRRADRTREET